MLAARDGAPISVDILRNLKRRQVPTDGYAGERNFLCAQRLAVCFGGVGAVGAAFADAGFADDERGLIGAVLCFCSRLAHSCNVMPVDGVDHIPSVGFETFGCVVDEPGRDFAVDRNAVVVVERYQFIELPCASQCTGFMADAFHQTTVTHRHIGMVVDDGVAVAVELGG